MAEPSAANTAPETPALDWQALLSQHRSWLRTVVVARLGSREGADEVLQEVALAAVRQQSPLSDPSKAAPWLYRLAVLQSLLFRRRMGRKRNALRRYADRALPTRTESDAVDPLDRLLAAERGQWVRDGIARLAQRDREVLLLKYVHDWSYREIARRLNISDSAVETRLFRARARLRDELNSTTVDSGAANPAANV